MREYYYLTQLGDSPYKLSLSDALHLGSTLGLGAYVFITDEITLQCRDTGEQVSDHDIYLQLPFNLVGAIEKTFVRRQSLNVGSALNDYHSLTQAIITDKYTGKVPMGTPFKQEPKLNFYAYISYPEGRPIQFPDVSYTVCISDLLCWSDDLERLAKHGHIKRRDSGEAPTVTADDDRKEYPPHLLELPQKFQQLYGAIAGGELPDLEAAINAWHLHWNQRAARGERDTYPANPHVQAWLEDRGLTKNKAESIPPLIRPKWG